MAPDVCSTPLVSVVVPVYNAAQWLPELFRSLVSQTYEAWEAILVDDGSTDGSAEICRRQAASDSRFRLVSKSNGGLASARNFGLEHASGIWICFVDADDMLMPTALERLLEVGVASGDRIVVSDFHYSEIPQKKVVSKSYERHNFDKAIEMSLYQNPPMNHSWGVLFYRDVFFPGGPRFREGRWYEDLDIHYRLFERVPFVVFLPEKFYFYRRNPSSFINTMSQGRFDCLAVTDEIFEHYKDTPLAPAAADRRFSAYFNVLMLLLKTGYQADDIMERCRVVVRQGRMRALRDSKVRFKNKVGALLSFGGIPFLRLIARFYR